MDSEVQFDAATMAALQENQKARVAAGRRLVAAYHSGDDAELADARAELNRLAEEVRRIERGGVVA